MNTAGSGYHIMDRKRFLQICGMLVPLGMLGRPEWLCAASAKKEKKERKHGFTFAFLTDVHLKPRNEGNCDEGLRKALDDVRNRNVDFILFGGDNVEANFHLGAGHEHEVVDMYTRFRKAVDESGIPAYFTIGNHDTFDRFEGEEDKIGYGYFRKFCGPVRQSFDHKGIHFVTLNSLVPDSKGRWSVGEEQREWLKNDLDAAGKDTPVIIAMHVPMLSLYYPVVDGIFSGADMVTDSKKVFDLLKQYNVRLVLQGHQHIHEEIQERGRWFVTGGGICASWWSGPLADTEEGYLLVHVGDDGDISWEYIDYGWTAVL